MADMTESEYQEQLRRERARRRRYEQRRRAHVRKQRIVFGGGGLLLILLLALIVRGCTAPKQRVSEIRSTANLKVLPEIIWDAEDLANAPTDADEGTTITLAAVGDIMCYDEQMTDAMTGSGYDFTPAFAEVKDVISGADLAVGNLETTFADGNAYAGKPNFNSPPELAAALAETGFDVLSTANTYSIQYGINGLYSTLLHVQQAGMDPVGTYYTQEERNLNGGAVIRDVGGVRVAFLAYTKGVNNMYLPDGYDYCVNLLYDDYYYAYTGFRKSEILADISAVKEAGADVIVCMLHWGSEYETEVSDSQREIADTLLGAGVNVILGAHSHVAGAVELREVTGSDGQVHQGLVAWSLGNFYSFMSRDGTMESLILRMQIEVSDDGSVKFSQVDYVPICTSYDGAGEHFRVTNLTDQMAKYIAVAEDAVDSSTYESYQAAARRIEKRVGTAYQPAEAAAPAGDGTATPQTDDGQSPAE